MCWKQVLLSSFEYESCWKQMCWNPLVLSKNLLNLKVLKPSSVEPVKQSLWGSSWRYRPHIKNLAAYSNSKYQDTQKRLKAGINGAKT